MTFLVDYQPLTMTKGSFGGPIERLNAFRAIPRCWFKLHSCFEFKSQDLSFPNF